MSTLQIAKKALALIGVVGVFAFTAASAQASTTWNESHPRRAEVNSRLGNQNSRINSKVADGKLTAAQGAQLHHEDHQIHTEEHLMASQNGGHITRSEQHTLNQQEDRVSGQIGSGR